MKDDKKPVPAKPVKKSLSHRERILRRMRSKSFTEMVRTLIREEMKKPTGGDKDEAA